MVARRLLVFVAVLMGLTALAAGLATPPGPHIPTRQQPILGTPIHAASPTVELSLDLAEPRTTVAVDEGEQVQLTVHGDVLDAIELVGLDLVEPIAADTPAAFDVLADRPGSYPVRILSSGRVVGRLRVNPRTG